MGFFASARTLDPPALALLSALAAWAPFLLLALPARHHYAQTAVPALAYLAAYAVTRLRLSFLLLAPIGWASVLSVAAVLAAVDRGRVAMGSDYDLPFREKERACKEVLARELDLVKFPRLEYLVLLEACYRALPESDRARFDLQRDERALYWDLVVLIPHPKKPRGRAIIQVEGPRAVIVEVP